MSLFSYNKKYKYLTKTICSAPVCTDHGHLGVLGQLALLIASRLKHNKHHNATFSREHPFPLNTFVCFIEIQIPGTTSSLLEPHPNKRGSLLSGQRHEQQTLHLRPLPAQSCCFKRPPCHHRPQRPGHRHRHQRPHLVHRPRCGLPHICPRGLHHCPAATAQAESSPELQLHPRR